MNLDMRNDASTRPGTKRWVAAGLVAGGVVTSAAALWPVSEAAAQFPAPIPLLQNLYIAKFTCGSQRPLSVNLPQPLEAGRYATSLSAFNTTGQPVTAAVAVSTPASNGPVALPPLTIPARGTAIVDCADIFQALQVSAVPDATVGSIYITRRTDDLEVRAAYTVREFGGDAAPESPSVDVERIPPREVPLVLIRSI